MYKIGDKVLYKNSITLRRIRNIDINGNLLLWGMYEYTDPKNVRKIYCTETTDCFSLTEEEQEKGCLYELTEEEFEACKGGMIEEDFKDYFLRNNVICRKCWLEELEQEMLVTCTNY